jgi:hypothetical protein
LSKLSQGLLKGIDALLQSIGLARYTPVGVGGRKTVNRMRSLFKNNDNIDLSNLPERSTRKKSPSRSIKG